MGEIFDFKYLFTYLFIYLLFKKQVLQRYYTARVAVPQRQGGAQGAKAQGGVESRGTPRLEIE